MSERSVVLGHTYKPNTTQCYVIVNLLELLKNLKEIIAEQNVLHDGDSYMCYMTEIECFVPGRFFNLFGKKSCSVFIFSVKQHL